jgi:hypothetical protein
VCRPANHLISFNLKIETYLASIAEDILTDGFWREQFWRKIDAKLKRLKVSPEVERAARAKINNRIPRPIENQ